MRCFYSSHPDSPDPPPRPPRHRFSWNFSSRSSSAPALKAPATSPAQLQTISEPIIPGTPEVAAGSLPPPSPPKLPRTLPDPRVFTLAELRAATRNFSLINLLGEGGFGCVYKGLLKARNGNERDMLVAVKQLNLKGKQGHKEWLAEVRYLGAVEHPNLVKLVGYCSEDDARGIQRLLVYEYMPNRSLEAHLFQETPSVLSWQQRLSLMLGAARGLAYLHEEITDLQVIFRDFKASNVLIDADFTPKLSDFGLAREGPELGATHVSTIVVGTLGYAAPEYIHTGHLTSKSDVWSFGVVLLEILSGRRALDRNRPKPEHHLIDWVRPNANGSRKISRIMDPRLEGNYSLVQAQKVTSLAFQCLGKHPRTRPPMSSVVKSLTEIIGFVDDGDMQGEKVKGLTAQATRATVGVKKAPGSDSLKKRKLLYNEIKSLKTKEDAQKIWNVWTPKSVST